jgi:hypothetical protein
MGASAVTGDIALLGEAVSIRDLDSKQHISTFSFLL